MYEPLTSNVPFMCMTFLDFPYPQSKAKSRKSGNSDIYHKTTEGVSHFGPQCSSLVTWAQFLEYIQEYAHQFELNKYVKLNHIVKRVRYLPAIKEEEIKEWKQKIQGPLKKFLIEAVIVSKEGEEESLYHTCDFLIRKAPPHAWLEKCGRYQGQESSGCGRRLRRRWLGVAAALWIPWQLLNFVFQWEGLSPPNFGRAHYFS